jgi:fucose 4-O-acetylase-like acetyltransferase
MMSDDWHVGFLHSSAVAQIPVDSVNLSLLSVVGYFRAVVNEADFQSLYVFYASEKCLYVIKNIHTFCVI